MLKIFFSPLMAVCLSAVGALLVYAGHRNATEFAALRDHGKTAQAELTKIEWKEKKRSHADGRYTAHVRFTTENGREVREKMNLPSELGRAIRGGAAPAVMTVRYLPESPATFREVNDVDASDAQSGVGRLLLGAGVALGALRWLIRRRRRREV